MKNRSITTHRYKKVKQFIVDEIRNQRWLPAGKIASENELVTLCKVSRMTARRAVEELSSEGILERIHGLGTFVKIPKISSSFLEIKDITEEITARKKHHSSHLLALESRICEQLAILEQPVTNCFYSEMIHFEDNSPVQFEIRQINPKIAPEYLQQNFTEEMPASYLLKTAPITRVNQIVEAIIPDARISELLDMTSQEPCLVINRTTWSGENWATFSRFYHPGNRYQLTT